MTNNCEFLTGEVLGGRYHLESLLGSGGMGEVYLATDGVAGDRKVAVKILKDPETVEWFKREFETLCLMVHPNIARVFDFDQDRTHKVYFYTCEYVEGRPAEEALEQATFKEKLDCFVRILRALHYIHSQGYLHCDMKPGNVLVSRTPDGDYAPRVLDFGLAMAVPHSSMAARGTFSYMAPEWLEGGIPGAYTDIYSTGIMFYEATFAKLPFEATDSASCIEFHTKGSLSFPEDEEVPAWWHKVLLRMTTREVADRYLSARECLSDIGRLSGLPLTLHEAAGLASESGLGGPWIGRSRTLLDTLDFYARVFSSDTESGICRIVRGERGIGKTRFLQELKRRAQVEGHSVVQVFPGAGGESAFQALSLKIRGLAGEETQGPRQDLISHMVARLAAQALAFASNHNLLLLVDDLDGLDEHCTAFVEALLNAADFAAQNGVPAARLAVVCTARPDDNLSMATHSTTATCDLGQLEHSLVGRLLGLVLGLKDVPEELVEEAWAACRGNPRLLHELALFLRDCGCLESTPGGVRFNRDGLPGGGYPQSVEQYLRQAWDRFGDEERRLLPILVLLYAPQPFSVLSEITDLEVWQIDQVVTDLAEREIVTFVVSGDRELPIVESETVRQVFASEFPAEEVTRLHRAIAEVLERRKRFSLPQPGALAHHWHCAGEFVRAGAYALEGAREQLAACNFSGALDLARIGQAGGATAMETAQLLAGIYRLWGKFEEGAEAIEELLDAEADGEARQEVAIHLCGLLFRAGRYARAEEILGPLAANEASPIAGRALALLARVFFFSGNHAASRRTGERGMLALAQTSRDFALCAAVVGLVRVYEGRLQQGVKYLETALAVLGETGSGSDQAFAANALGIAHHKLKDYPAAQSYYRQSLETAQRTGDVERINTSAMNLSVVLQETGDYGQAISQYQEALAMAHQSRNLPLLARVYNNLGNIHRYLGVLQKARDFAERSIELADQLNMGLSKGLNRMLMGEILCLQGHHPEAAAMLDQAGTVFEEAKAADEAIECDIDRVELLTAQENFEAASVLGNEAVAASAGLKLDNHRLRALLATSQAMLKRNRADDPGRTALLLDDAAQLVADVGNPELEFKLWCLRTQTHTALGGAEKAALALRRAENALTMLKQRLPEEFHSVFFKRADRRRTLAEFTRISSRMAQLALTISPDSPSAPRMVHRQRWMGALIRMNERLLAVDDLERLLETLIDVVVDLSDAERGFVILASDSGLDVVVARNMDREAIRKSRAKFSTSIALKVLETGEAIRLEDAIEADDFRTKKSVMALRIRSVICLPITGRNGPIGAIYVDNRFKPGVFNESVVEMLNAFCEQAAIAIENARLLRKYRSTVDELKASREEVEKLNSRLEEKVKFQRLVIEQKSEVIDHQQEQLEERYQFENMVGRSRALEGLFTLMRRVARTHVPVLVTGESGSGKELVARGLHFSGPRRKQRFISINCAALPDSLLESELFGFVEGAFTDARREKKGLFAIADGGTLFMDEVGDMSLTMQAKLLRVLQEGEFSPLGAEETVHVDVRIVAATNKDLKALARDGTFRQDLYYRLDVVSIKVPPLRDRKEDIPLLVDHFLDAYTARSNAPKPNVTLPSLQILMSYDWPGNVRELQSVVTTSAVFAEGGQITVESLRTKPEIFGDGAYADALPNLGTLELRELEKKAIIAALIKAQGNKQQAARLLCISRRALYNKLESHKIDTAQLR